MLAFVLSPFGRVLALILALVAWTAYQRHDATVTERDRLTEINQAATAAEVARQTAASAAAASAAQERADAAEVKAKELQEIANDLKAELSQTGVVCPIPDGLRKRLLAIH
jgi:hypothetical protein